jgi:SPP1 gp7 family putative phage head morphogenesis protein
MASNRRRRELEDEELPSERYWRDREDEALRHYIRDEAEYDRQIRRIYTDMLDACQRDIESFYSRYAGAEGITIAEAKKRVSQLDIAEYERKAERYVRERNFSEQANEEMRLYNATMRINRMEMLRANIGLELIAGHDELNNLMGEILQGRTMEELERMSGILGETVLHNTRKAAAIVNGSFHNGTFSDRIWQYQDLMREDLGKLLQQGLIQGKNPRALTKDLRKYLLGDKVGKGATYNVERLMRTELRRVQTEAQKQSFERNGFEMYRFHCNVHPSKSHTCEICKQIASQDKGFGKGIYLVEDMMPGLNAPPMHPNCRCSTSAYEDSEEYEAWLDYLDKGGTTAEWKATGKAEWKSK